MREIKQKFLTSDGNGSNLPPNSSADISSPVAALTNGGPPRKIVPCFRTMILSSAMAGT